MGAISSRMKVSAITSRLGIFRDRNYVLYTLGDTVFALGMWAQRIGGMLMVMVVSI